MRYSLIIAVLAVTLPFGSATAQSPDVLSRCAQAVGRMKFEGYPADRNRDMMMLACQANGGRIPGAPEEKPAALHRQPAR